MRVRTPVISAPTTVSGRPARCSIALTSCAPEVDVGASDVCSGRRHERLLRDVGESRRVSQQLDLTGSLHRPRLDERAGRVVTCCRRMASAQDALGDRRQHRLDPDDDASAAQPGLPKRGVKRAIEGSLGIGGVEVPQRVEGEDAVEPGLARGGREQQVGHHEPAGGIRGANERDGREPAGHLRDVAHRHRRLEAAHVGDVRRRREQPRVEAGRTEARGRPEKLLGRLRAHQSATDPSSCQSCGRSTGRYGCAAQTSRSSSSRGPARRKASHPSARQAAC